MVPVFDDVLEGVTLDVLEGVTLGVLDLEGVTEGVLLGVTLGVVVLEDVAEGVFVIVEDGDPPFVILGVLEGVTLELLLDVPEGVLLGDTLGVTDLDGVFVLEGVTEGVLEGVPDEVLDLEGVTEGVPVDVTEDVFVAKLLVDIIGLIEYDDSPLAEGETLLILLKEDCTLSDGSDDSVLTLDSDTDILGLLVRYVDTVTDGEICEVNVGDSNELNETDLVR